MVDTDANASVNVKSVPQRRGGTSYGIDPEMNPASVVISPRGVLDESGVIAGCVGTGMVNDASTELLNLLARELRRQFERI